MSRIITGIILKSYMAVARLMGDVDKKRKRSAKVKLRATSSVGVKKIKLKQA